MRNFDLILLVEDDDVDTYINQVMLQRSGLAKEVVRCENGMQALEMVRNIYPDLILLDINMPVMDGIEFLHALREENLESTPIVMLTCSNDLKDISRAAAYRVKYYLVKPLTEEKLAKMVERCFN